MNLHRRLLLLLVAALMVAVTAVAAVGPAFGKAGQDSASSVSTGELSAEWWKWALSKPSTEFPLIGEDPDYTEEQCNGQPVTNKAGKYWFLAGTFDGSEVDRTCTIPAGKQLFFPVANEGYLLDPGQPAKEGRKIVNGFMDSIVADPEFKSGMSVTVDGQEIKNNQVVRADSPLFTATVPDGGIVDPGSYSMVSDGLWVTLPTLSEGEHTIHFKMSAPSVPFSQDNTYHLTVE
jgi:hypothetical protein